MPSSSQKSNKTIGVLQDTLGPDTQGILWFTDEKLEDHPIPFDSLDYFFEGTLSQNLTQSSRQDGKKNFFITRCFGEPFFLAHITSKSSVDGELKEIFQIVGNMNQKAKNIIVIETGRKEVMAGLKKKYPKEKFIQLDVGNA